VGVTLDLPAYDALVQALVASNRLDDAVGLLGEISEDNDISPTERSYFPLLEAMIKDQEYDAATALLRAARSSGVTFSSEVGACPAAWM
jgi:pentatricopeptide repeat protein